MSTTSTIFKEIQSRINCPKLFIANEHSSPMWLTHMIDIDTNNFTFDIDQLYNTLQRATYLEQDNNCREIRWMEDRINILLNPVSHLLVHQNEKQIDQIMIINTLIHDVVIGHIKEMIFKPSIHSYLTFVDALYTILHQLYEMKIRDLLNIERKQLKKLDVDLIYNIMNAIILDCKQAMDGTAIYNHKASQKDDLFLHLSFNPIFYNGVTDMDESEYNRNYNKYIVDANFTTVNINNVAKNITSPIASTLDEFITSIIKRTTITRQRMEVKQFLYETIITGETNGSNKERNNPDNRPTTHILANNHSSGLNSYKSVLMNKAHYMLTPNNLTRAIKIFIPIISTFPGLLQLLGEQMSTISKSMYTQLPVQTIVPILYTMCEAIPTMQNTDHQDKTEFETICIISNLSALHFILQLGAKLFLNSQSMSREFNGLHTAMLNSRIPIGEVK